MDDAAVNAFALPGGFVYMTRGILGYLDSEAELAMVMGHEVGHVTARHSASQMSSQQLMSLGMGIGMVAVPELRKYGDLAQLGLGLLFLKFGRDDENEADTLGLRYSKRLDYDAAELFFNLRWKQNDKFKLFLDMRLEDKNYVEDYTTTTYLEPLDFHSTSVEPGSRRRAV